MQVLGRPLIQQPRVRTMTVEDGHVVDVDGGKANASNAGAKYAQGSVPTSGVGRNSLFAPTSDDENANQVRTLPACGATENPRLRDPASIYPLASWVMTNHVANH